MGWNRLLLLLLLLLILVVFGFQFFSRKRVDILENFTSSSRSYIEKKLSRIGCNANYYFENNAVCFKCVPDFCFEYAVVDRGVEGLKMNVIGEYVKTMDISKRLVEFFYPELVKCYPKCFNCSFVLNGYPANVSNFYLKCNSSGDLEKIAGILFEKYVCCQNMCGNGRKVLVLFGDRVVPSLLIRGTVEERCGG